MGHSLLQNNATNEKLTLPKGGSPQPNFNLR